MLFLFHGLRWSKKKPASVKRRAFLSQKWSFG
jgi:hypothetical protein